MVNPVLGLVQLIIDGDDRAAGISEDDIHLLLQQNLYKHLRAGYEHCLPPFPNEKPASFVYKGTGWSYLKKPMPHACTFVYSNACWERC